MSWAAAHRHRSERHHRDQGSSGNLIVAAWNLVDPGAHGGAKTMELSFQGVSPAPGGGGAAERG